MQKDLTGRLKWRPADFWSATLYDCQTALKGMNEGDQDRLRALSVQASWVLNYIPAAVIAVFSKKGRSYRVSPTDHYHPVRTTRITKDEADEYRSRLKERLKQRGGMKRPPGYFRTKSRQGHPSTRRAREKSQNDVRP